MGVRAGTPRWLRLGEVISRVRQLVSRAVGGGRAEAGDAKAPRARRFALDASIAALVIGLFCFPLLFRTSTFATDFTNSLWLGWVQSLAIANEHVPTLFDQATSFGLFSPSYVFYGGAAFEAVGAVSALAGGHFIVVFELFSAGVVVMAYGGALWLARLCGARGLIAHAAPIAIVSAAYYATDLYGRGAWPEWVGFSSIPLFLASNLSVLRSERLRPGPLAALAISTMLFSGSHNAVLLWGVLLLVLLGGVGLLLLGTGGISARRALRSLALVALAVGLNAWFLLADVAFGTTTGETQFPMSSFFFDSARVLFDPGRYVPPLSSTPGLYVQAPVWFLAWTLAVGLALFFVGPRAANLRRARRAFLLGFGATALLLGLIMATPLWPRMPSVIRDIQFPYRLNGFVFLLTAGAMLPLLGVLQRLGDEGGRKRFLLLARGSLLVASLTSLGLCGWQVLVASESAQVGSLSTRSEALISTTIPPATWYESAQVYDDISEPVISVPASRAVTIPATDVSPGGNSLLVLINLPPGPAPIALNVVAGPQLATVGGDVTRIGRTDQGFVVVRRIHLNSGPALVEVSEAHNLELVGGGWLSVASALTLVVLLLWALGRPLLVRSLGRQLRRAGTDREVAMLGTAAPRTAGGEEKEG